MASANVNPKIYLPWNKGNNPILLKDDIGYYYNIFYNLDNQNLQHISYLIIILHMEN